MDEIDNKLSQVFSNSDAKGHAGESFDTANMSKRERHQVVERALMNTRVGRPCFGCGEAFDEKSSLTSYFIGPISDGGGAAYAHKKCFRETIKVREQCRVIKNY